MLPANRHCSRNKGKIVIEPFLTIISTVIPGAKPASASIFSENIIFPLPLTEWSSCFLRIITSLVWSFISRALPLSHRSYINDIVSPDILIFFSRASSPRTRFKSASFIPAHLRSLLLSILPSLLKWIPNTIFWEKIFVLDSKNK